MRNFVLFAALCGGLAAANAQTPQKPAAQRPMPQLKPAYDMYEPSQRQRLRRETCMKDEAASGPFCVKKCQAGYVMEGERPVKCRSATPLPPGTLPTSTVRKEIGIQNIPQQPARPANAEPRP